ncbi:unnamed protein product [Clonostachys rhizophaga]|uniref:Uncharacterized protein n=1 Tax=Clonostachys rhizophaga TaxID=160324 RepID=A0A9N9YU97_9HYPO|nr:unnamed protein product [Clonostachys rhizophaga]
MASKPTIRQVLEDLETSAFEDAGYESESFDVEQEETALSSIKKSLTICFPIRSNYSPSWNTSAAFRELVQNWRDGIIQSFKLKETQFYVAKEDKSTDLKAEILFKALNKAPGVSDHDSCMGFIRFSGRHGTGIVEITNRAASLQPKHLDFGQSDKRGNENQAGVHGEGLKVALLVFLRRNHRVRCISGNVMWNFNFTTAGKLVARLNKMQQEAVIREKRSAKKLKDDHAVPFQVSPYHDVRFFIGEKGKGRDGIGESTQRQHVSLETFNTWCRSALFLRDLPNQEETLITTKHGELILDVSVQGNLYLKGLLLMESNPDYSASISGRPLKYAYNFRHGATNRDRKSIASSNTECWTILNIWNDALQQKPDLIAALHEMLLSTDPGYADVHLAESLMGIELAKKLRDHLFSDQSKWYYSDKEISEDPRLKTIIQGLGRTGSRLPDSYWSILSRLHLIHTAKEEQEDQFLKSRIAMVPADKFAESLSKVLRSCIQGIPAAAHINVEFVQAGQLRLHTYFKDVTFKIHQRWLDNDQVVRELGLPSDVPESDVLFHAIQWLVRELIDQMPEGQFAGTEDHTVEWDKKRVTNCAVQRLFEYININNSVTLHQTPSEDASKLILEWNRFSSWCQEAVVNVQLHHKASCQEIHDRLLSKEFDPEKLPCKKLQEEPAEDVKPTACFSMNVQPGLGSYSFENLTRGSEYFGVIVKQSEPDSIALISEMCKLPRLPAEVIDLTMDEVPAPTQSEITLHLPVNQSQSDEDQVSLASIDDVRSGSEYDDEEEEAPSFCAVRPIENLDILQPRDWYEARSHNVEGAVIGILKPKSTRGRKRQREQHEALPRPKRVAKSTRIGRLRDISRDSADPPSLSSMSS